MVVDKFILEEVPKLNLYGPMSGHLFKPYFIEDGESWGEIYMLGSYPPIGYFLQGNCTNNGSWIMLEDVNYYK